MPKLRQTDSSVKSSPRRGVRRSAESGGRRTPIPMVPVGSGRSSPQQGPLLCICDTIPFEHEVTQCLDLRILAAWGLPDPDLPPASNTGVGPALQEARSGHVSTSGSLEGSDK